MEAVSMRCWSELRPGGLPVAIASRPHDGFAQLRHRRGPDLGREGGARSRDADQRCAVVLDTDAALGEAAEPAGRRCPYSAARAAARIVTISRFTVPSCSRVASPGL
jgi:hypothetical protein